MNIDERLRRSLGQYDDIVITHAPGRINLIGEHTDYNAGMVLPASIDSKMSFGFALTNDSKITLRAIDINESCELEIDNLKAIELEWANYLIGNMVTLQKKGLQLKGFECCFSSDIPIGSGLSSSAALDCGFIYGLSQLFDFALNPWEVVLTANESNNNFLGVKSGILDQFASVFGLENKAMCMDCGSRTFEYVEFDPKDVVLVLVNSGVKHSHMFSAYNDRVNECEAAVKDIQKIYPEITHLSDPILIDRVKEISFTNTMVESRAKFIINENLRVKSFVEALANNDYDKCGQLLYQSHVGLSKMYEVSCLELDFLVDLFRNDESVLGSRMMGGGFGGCTINMVKEEYLDAFKEKATQLYHEKYQIIPEIYDVVISNGAAHLNADKGV